LWLRVLLQVLLQVLNMINKPAPTSCYRVVSWNKTKQKWMVNLKIEGKQVQVGKFDIGSEIQAAECYDKAKIKIRSFVGLNFYHYKELQEDTCLAAVAAIAAATIAPVVGSSSKPTCRFMGAYFDANRASPNKWNSRIQVEGVVKYLGYYNNEEDAARAYGLAKRSLAEIPEHSEPTDLLSYMTNKEKSENLLTVRSRYMSDVLVRTNISFDQHYYDHHHYYDILLYCCAYITLSTAHCPNLLK
jgi:hypothetical protein